VVEDPSARVKRVENWRRRLLRARERLGLAGEEERGGGGGGVEIWTWRVGGDVEHICGGLVEKEMERRKRHGGGIGKELGGVQRENQIYNTQ
jgi:hypothetical protein